MFVKIIDIDLERRVSRRHQAGERGRIRTSGLRSVVYGMAAEYDVNGTTYPEGFDPETQEWMEGYDEQRIAWETQYAEAQARWEAHKAQVARALEEDAEAAPQIEEQASYSTPVENEGTLASDEALAALREKLTNNSPVAFKP